MGGKACVGTGDKKDWHACEDYCNEQGCALWTFKYDGCGDWNGGNNCWLKSDVKWPGSFNEGGPYSGSNKAKYPDKNTISGGSYLDNHACYGPCGAIDRTDTCEDPVHDHSSPQCKSTPAGSFDYWARCADAAAKQGSQASPMTTQLVHAMQSP